MTTTPASTPTGRLTLSPTSGEAGDLAALTAFDRCDSRDCTAQAYVRARLKSSLELVFCGHHGHDLLPALAGQGAVVRDDCPLLVEDRLRDRDC